MKLSGPQFQQLQHALLSAYPTANMLAQMVRIYLEENLHIVAGGADLNELVFNLIRWAEAGGRLTALVEGAHAANSGNPALDAFVTEVWQGLVSPSPAQRTSTPDATLRKQPSYPPFIVGSPVPPGQMVDRQIALRRVVERILDFLPHLAGGHPYLLQAAGAALWEAYDFEPPDSRARHAYVFDHLQREHGHQFTDTWRIWRAETRQAFVCVALAYAQTLLSGHPLELGSLLELLPSLEPELNDLAHVGLIARQPTVNGGWQVQQRMMLAWLLRELTPTLRSAATFEQWLRSADLHDHWSPPQRHQLWSAVQHMAARASLLRERLIAP
jgi:hypothetical protein